MRLHRHDPAYGTIFLFPAIELDQPQVTSKQPHFAAQSVPSDLAGSRRSGRQNPPVVSSRRTPSAGCERQYRPSLRLQEPSQTPALSAALSHCAALFPTTSARTAAIPTIRRRLDINRQGPLANRGVRILALTSLPPHSLITEARRVSHPTACARPLSLLYPALPTT